MQVRLNVLAAVCALSPLGALAGGDTVPCADHKAGSWFRFAERNLVYESRSEHVARIESIDGDRVRGTNEQGLPVITDLSLNPYSIGERKATPKFYRIPECPFALGETRVYRDVEYDGFFPGTRERGTFTVSVDPEFVSLKVPAGTSKVIRVVTQLSYGTGDAKGNARTEVFYSPEIGYFVQREFYEKLLSGRDMHLRYELLEYSPAK